MKKAQAQTVAESSKAPPSAPSSLMASQAEVARNIYCVLFFRKMFAKF